MTRSRRPVLALAGALLALVLGLAVAPAATAAPAFPPGQLGTATINATVFPAGGRVVVTVANTTPGTVTLELVPAGQTLGTSTVGGRGKGTVQGRIPFRTAPGSYAVQVLGAGGELYQFSVVVTARSGA